MNTLLHILLPEIILVSVACLLFLIGAIDKPLARKISPLVAFLALLIVFGMELLRDGGQATQISENETFRVYRFSQYIKMITAGVGALLVLLAWPVNREGTGNGSIDFGRDTSEFFGLMLLAITGVFLTASANDMILLFLGIELASIPTYIMVSMSRPISEAQEAGVKYFFLGALAAALMLFGFSYLYGVTGETNLYQIMFNLSTQTAHSNNILGNWWKLGAIMLIAGLCFKIAAVPLHFYVGDVYQGAATPVTAFLSFVPKVSGFVAIVRVLQVLSGGNWLVPEYIEVLLWVLAVLTMTVGNVLALMQLSNIKRVFAYSSVAHSGYMLVGLAAMSSLDGGRMERIDALQGVLFYLAAYGIMNTGAFAVLMLLPSRGNRLTTSAETFEDIAGQGRRHVGLGLAMAVACFSLTGLPLTVGFFGKLLLIKAAIDSGLIWLAVIALINAAISAGYYLAIVAAMFLREPSTAPAQTSKPQLGGGAVMLALILSTAGTLLFGSVPPATQALILTAEDATQFEQRNFAPILQEYRELDEAFRRELGQ